MSNVVSINLLAVALAVAAAVVGYWTPVVGIVVGFVLVLILVSVVWGDGNAVADFGSWLWAFGRWLAVKDDFRWLRRAPVLGLVVGALAQVAGFEMTHRRWF